MTWGPRSCEQVPRRLGPPRPPRRARHRVASASCPVWGVEPPGAPLRSPRLVWGGGGRVRVRRHRRLRPLCRAPRDQPPNFFPGRRPLPRGRRWQPAGPQGARARRSRRRRRRGSESGEVNRRSQSFDPGHGGRRLVLERGGPTLWLPWPSWNCLTRELHSGLEAPVGQDPAWKAGRRRRRGRRGCGASSLSPNQAISLQSAAGALGAHTAQDLPPRRGASLVSLLLSSCTGPLASLDVDLRLG